MINESNIDKCDNSYTKSKLPFTVVVQRSKGILAIKKLYDVVLKLLFFAIAVLALFVGVVVDAVLSSTSRKREKLSIG